MNKINKVGLSFLLVVILFLGACAEENASSTNMPGNDPAQPTETVVDSNMTTVGSFKVDPANISANNVEVSKYLYEGLVSTQNGELAGFLAESYTVSADGLDYIFNLRPNVTFHDGTMLNADVVILNFNRWFDPNDVNRGAGLYTAWAANFSGFKGETLEDGKAKSQYDGIEKVDEFTVLIHLNRPDPEFLNKMTDSAFSIMSSNSLGNAGDGGSGPYMVSGKNDTEVTLSPFTKYWNQSAIPNEDIQIQYK